MFRDVVADGLIKVNVIFSGVEADGLVKVGDVFTDIITDGHQSQCHLL